MRFHVSFVCTGNICRSPMAALVFAEHVRRAGLADAITVTSAGTGPWHVGEPADTRARRILTGHGYPTAHTARQVDEAELGADLLLAMASEHEAVLLRNVEDPARVRMYRSFDPAATGELSVPDPYYGSMADYETVYAMVEAATPGLLAHVTGRLAS